MSQFGFILLEKSKKQDNSLLKGDNVDYGFFEKEGINIVYTYHANEKETHSFMYELSNAIYKHNPNIEIRAYRHPLGTAENANPKTILEGYLEDDK